MSQGGIFDFNSFNKDVTSKSQELSKIYQEQLKQISKIAKENPNKAKLENLESTKEEMPGLLKQTFGGEKEAKEGRVRSEKQMQEAVKPEAKSDAQAKVPVSAKTPQPLEAPKPPSPAKLPTLEEANKRLDQNVTQFLAQNKIPLTEENKELAKMMLLFSAQVEEKHMHMTMQRIRTALAEVPNSAREEQQSACFLQANNSQVNKENITNLSSYLKDNSQISNKFAEIQSTAAQLASTSENLQTVKVFSRLSDLLGRFIVQPDSQTAQEMKLTLFKLAQTMGIERDLSKVVFRQASSDPNFKPDQKMMETVYQQTDIGKLAGALSSLADKLAGNAAEKALLIKIVDLVSQLSQNILGARIVNEAGINKANEGYPGFYCMNIPMRFGEELSNGKLIISFKPYGNVDPENVKIDFRIETERLGFMQFVLDIVNNVIQGNVYVETEKVKELVEKNITDFKKAILSQLYQIKYITCDLLEEGKVKFLSEISFDNLDILTA